MLWSIGGRSKLVRIVAAGLVFLVLLNVMLWDNAGKCTAGLQDLRRQTLGAGEEKLLIYI